LRSGAGLAGGSNAPAPPCPLTCPWAHGAGLPARYVTGYLLTGEETETGEASHAWAEVFVGGLGWVGFDPANRCCPDDRYIRLGSGRDARAAAPIRGVSRGGGMEAMDVTVIVAQQ
jgi:transglutaminase-like putative cysteine protease